MFTKCYRLVFIVMEVLKCYNMEIVKKIFGDYCLLDNEAYFLFRKMEKRVFLSGLQTRNLTQLFSSKL